MAGSQFRVRSLTTPDGSKFWLKRAERLSLRLRLQKGDPRAALQAERQGLRVLGEGGLPAAPIALQGEEYLVLPDVGRTLHAMLHDKTVSHGELCRAFAQAGLSLARLHRAGFVHGRPAIRDICWDGQEARFIDLERFSVRRRGVRQQALDVVMFVQTLMTLRAGDTVRADAAGAVAVESYAAHAPEATLHALGRVIRWLAVVGWLAARLRRLRPASRELQAVGPTLKTLRQLVR